MMPVFLKKKKTKQKNKFKKLKKLWGRIANRYASF